MILFWKPTEKYGFLSNWSVHSIKEDTQVFKTAEHYVMYQKAMLMNDEETAKLIYRASTPFKAKQLGRLVKNFDPVIWDAEKMSIMTRVLELKANQHQEIKQFLLHASPNTIFVEASPYDRVWGIGLNVRHPDAKVKSKWRGQNLLGECWTSVLNKIKE